jgi:membrane-associated phospholipid phosphatase
VLLQWKARAGRNPGWPRMLSIIMTGWILFVGGLPEAFSQEFTIDPAWDGAILGSGALLGGASELLVPYRDPPDLGEIDIQKLNAVDRWALFPYSRGVDLASTVLEITTIAVPLLLMIVLPEDQWIPMGVLYGETLCLADISKNVLKYLFPRYRPYMYPGGTDKGGPDGGENYDSFPSGHATMAFSAAAFATFVYASYFPDSPYLIPLAVADCGLAALTASFRVFAGMHFISDIVVGTAIGVASGCLVPLLHRNGTGTGNNSRIALSIPLASFRL